MLLSSSNSNLQSFEAVQTPQWLRTLAYNTILLTLLLMLVIGFIPWQQTVIGTGQVSSLSPNNRPQKIEAPIKGRIIKWHVTEGQHVKAGDLLVELQDLEKEYLPTEFVSLTESSKRAIELNQQSYMSKAESIDLSIQNIERNISESLDAAKRSIQVAKGELETAKLNLTRTESLAAKGLASTRDRELAVQAEIKARGDLERAEIEFKRISSKGQADITKLESERASSLAEVSKASDELAKINLKLNTMETRQELSHIKAPSDGVVVKLIKRGTGEIFKENDQIAVITPQSTDQSAEIYVQDIDAPLIMPGAEVRLQFSGWPALQFAGLSKNVKLGTFEGVVSVVDNVDSGNGKYRVLIVPKKEGDWPSSNYLRPGTRVAAWVILKTVPLGYELWRRFNGFPIALADIHNTEVDGNYSPSKEEDKKQSVIFKKQKR